VSIRLGVQEAGSFRLFGVMIRRCSFHPCKFRVICVIIKAAE
ncbi:MAG: hypothetical protein ACI85U_001939, partial [Candidatus Promineifilaceae bacterium]